MVNPLFAQNNGLPAPPKRVPLVTGQDITDSWYKWLSQQQQILNTGNLAVINTNTITVSGTVTAAGGFYGTLHGNADSASTIEGGLPGELLYQIDTNVTGFVTVGNEGQVLTIVSGLPVWQDTPIQPIPPTPDPWINAMICSTMGI